MKPTIDQEQIEQLSPHGRRSLEDWCSNKHFDITSLHVGQAMEFLHDAWFLVHLQQYVKKDLHHTTGFIYWKVICYNMKTGHMVLEADAPHLIDALWNAMRYVLEPENLRPDNEL